MVRGLCNMNKIFKVVWSKVRNAYVVVSEIAKNTVSGVGKRNRVKRFSFGATLAAYALAGSFFLPNWALAAESAMVDAQKSHYIAIGYANTGTNPFTGIQGVTASGPVYSNGKYQITVTFNKICTVFLFKIKLLCHIQYNTGILHFIFPHFKELFFDFRIGDLIHGLPTDKTIQKMPVFS